MTQEEQNTPGEEGAETEMSQETAPTLNRAERRAQAKGKKGVSGGSHPSALQNRLGGNAPRTSFAVNKSRFPRTGHK